MPGQNRRAMRFVTVAALVLVASLSACAGSGGVGSSEGVSGDERGGKIPYQDGAVSSAMSAAQAHCGKFGKKAQITQMNPSADGGQIAFLCS
jgi:hypothetical protein